MKLFKKKDKNIEAEETLAKNAESAKTAAAGKNAGAAQETKEDVPETIVCPKCGKTVLKSVVKQHKYVCYECNYYFRVRAPPRPRPAPAPAAPARALSSVRQRFTARRQCLV